MCAFKVGLLLKPLESDSPTSCCIYIDSPRKLSHTFLETQVDKYGKTKEHQVKKVTGLWLYYV